MGLAGIALAVATSGSAQMAPDAARLSLPAAVDLALRTSPKVKMAQADVKKARAALSETKDAFIPIVDSTAGVGKSSGPPLAVPVVFSVAAQSLVFNFSQLDYVRAAQQGVNASNLTLAEVSEGVVEETSSTYVGLENAQRRKLVLSEALGDADKLVEITQSRYSSGVDSHGEVSRAQVTQARLKLQMIQVEAEVDELSVKLSHLTGLKAGPIVTVADSIPAYETSLDSYAPAAPRESPGMLAAAANAKAKWYTAHGDSRYMLLPQLSFGANYSRITTAFTNYDLYYPAFNRNAANNENALSLGVQIMIPLLDIMHKSKARVSAAEALRAKYEVEDQRIQFLDGRVKLSHSLAELSARADLANAERTLAQDDLEAIQTRLKADAAGLEGQAMTPKDEQNGRLQERQKYLEMLSVDLQLRQSEITLMRQNGSLGEWLHRGLVNGAGANVAAPASTRP